VNSAEIVVHADRNTQVNASNAGLNGVPAEHKEQRGGDSGDVCEGGNASSRSRLLGDKSEGARLLGDKSDGSGFSATRVAKPGDTAQQSTARATRHCAAKLRAPPDNMEKQGRQRRKVQASLKQAAKQCTRLRNMAKLCALPGKTQQHREVRNW
jgi:hypothetical protein